ncbi:MAG: twin-arginine translocase TatA/TatE family subunit [bacterium]
MIAGLGHIELLIVFVIVLLLFGVGRIGKIGHELGTGIRAFREGVREGTEPADADEASADDA